MKTDTGADEAGNTDEGAEAAAAAEALRVAEEAGEIETLVAIGKDPAEEADADAEIEAPLEDGTPPSEPMKALRRKARDDAKALRKLEAERDAALAAAVTKPKADADAVVVGDKPTLEGCDYDAGKLETELAEWLKRKSDAESLEKRKADARKEADQVYAGKYAAYTSGKATLKVADFATAEKAVEAGLTVVQQSILIRHAKNPALVVYALGQDAAKLKELGAITDPVEFAANAAFLESEIKAVNKPKFRTDTKPSGNGSGTLSTGANALEKARTEAERTGDYSKVHALKKSAKEAAKK